MTEERFHTGVETFGRLRIITEDKQCRDDRTIDTGSAEGFLRVIADQDPHKGKQPFAEDLHVTEHFDQCAVRGRISGDPERFKQCGKAEQQTHTDKPGNERGKNSGEFGEKTLYRICLFFFQMLLLISGNLFQAAAVRFTARYMLIQIFLHQLCGGLCFARPQHNLELLITFNHTQHALNFFDGDFIRQLCVVQCQTQAGHTVTALCHVTRTADGIQNLYDG